jgi:hypothetical protein
MVSNGSSVSLKELVTERARLAEQDGVQPAKFWFQLYLRRGDRTQNDEDLKTAADAKVDAIVLTMDAVALGNHEKNRNHPERLMAAGEIKADLKGIKPLPMGRLERERSFLLYTQHLVYRSGRVFTDSLLFSRYQMGTYRLHQVQGTRYSCHRQRCTIGRRHRTGAQAWSYSCRAFESWRE